MDNIRDYKFNSERWLSLEDFEGEVWKDIADYEGLYRVSSCGRVKSLERHVERKSGKTMFVKERICRPYMNKGYLYVRLSKDGVQPNKKVHRLVAEAFIPNTNNYPDVNHKDEVPSNNIVSNIEWCTKEYNFTYGTRLKRMKETWRKVYGVPIIRYNADGSISKKYECSKDLINDGFDRRAVYRCCNGRNIFHKGYKWGFC